MIYLEILFSKNVLFNGDYSLMNWTQLGDTIHQHIYNRLPDVGKEEMFEFRIIVRRTKDFPPPFPTTNFLPIFQRVKMAEKKKGS
ncbi:MAG: hypothetical protein AB1774_12355 [Bacillota bacterium]